MILAFDTYYYDDKANTVCLSFDTWADDTPKAINNEILGGIAEYESGAFYKRELPCIISLLKQYDMAEIDCIIIDGYVVLDNEGKLGLGGYLYAHLDQQIPVIGVAKSKFTLNEQLALPLFRGDSKRPLFISAKGIELNTAFEYIKSMHGKFRMPTLLQVLDTESKKLRLFF